MTGYKWQCPRCGMMFVERKGEIGKAGACGEPKCSVVHGDGNRINNEPSRPWVRPGQTADLRRVAK